MKRLEQGGGGRCVLACTRPAPGQRSRLNPVLLHQGASALVTWGASVCCRRRPGQPEKSQPESTSHRISHNLYNPKAKNSEPRKAAQKQGRQGSGFLHFRCDPRLSRDTDPLTARLGHGPRSLGVPISAIRLLIGRDIGIKPYRNL